MSYRGGSGGSNSSATYKRILNDIRSQNPAVKLSGLEKITETIAFSEPSQLRNFPLQEACKEFVKIVQNSNDIAMLTLSSQCIVNVLDLNPDSSRILTMCNFIQVAKTRLYGEELSKGVLENLIHALCAITKTRAKDVAQNVGVKFIMNNLEKLSGPERHYAVAALARFTSYYATAKFGKSLPDIAGYFSSNDEQIALNMITAFTNIMNAINFSDIPKEAVESICISTSLVSNPKTLIKLLELLQRLIFYKQFAECLIDVGINYEVLLNGNDFGNDSSKIRSITMQLIRSLLPSPDFPTGFWESERHLPSNCQKLAETLAPILLKLAMEKAPDSNFIYANLAMVLKLHPIDVPNQLFHILIASSQNVQLAPFVLLLAINIPDKKALSASGLSAHLSKIKVDGYIAEWYKQNLTILKSMAGSQRTKIPKPSSFKKFKDIFDFINNCEMSAFELQASGYIAKLLELLRLEQNASSFDFSHIRDIMHQIITYSNIPDLIDPFESYSSKDFAKGSILVDIKYNNKTYKHKQFDNESLFIAIEAWYNEAINHVTTNDMLDAAKHSGRIGMIVSLEHAGSINYTHIGILHRAFGTKKYKKFSFKMNQKKYSACDFMFQSIARSLQSPDLWPVITPLIELIDEDTLQMSMLDVPRDNIPNKIAFEILQLIHIHDPNLDLYSVEFEKALLPHLMSFFLDVSLFSPAVQIAANFPFLFSFEFRSYVLRLISPDFFSALSFAQRAIFNTSEKLRDGRMYNHCTVSRSSLFDDGVLLMNSIAKGPIQLDISFDNEAGFGSGPTKEFFSSLAIEFTRNRNRMWRSDDLDAEFAFTKIGLFPKYGAKPAHFFALGVLCAKAVSMNSVLPIPFSVEFFKLIKGQTLTMEEVDSVYAQSLKAKQGLIGLNFVLPGNKYVELVKGGKNRTVTEKDVDEYIRLVEDFTFGSKLNSIRQSFLDGFATVFQRGIWSMLEAVELRTLIAGENVKITMKDLIDNIEISHGYEKDSPQIKMLFEIVTEFNDKEKSLFVKFITGSERLPIGGLASLQPHLAIAKKVDETVANQDDALPSVMTCTNYFKLPPYSTKEKMKEKLLLAIQEGQGAFLLT